uniref:Uncharacterized protein n=1 Tax=Acartia pacifica TaxID=335913 RepID=A0A0U2T4Y7_ACAPC|nr:hypothetical protein [Acartia pacifica]
MNRAHYIHINISPFPEVNIEPIVRHISLINIISLINGYKMKLEVG